VNPVRVLLRVLLVVASTALALATPAVAQVPDHLKCYKVRDPLQLSGTVDLDSPQFGVDTGCKILQGIPPLFCVPATKTVVEVRDRATGQPITPLPISGPDPGDRLCYKLKCDAPSPPDIQVTDQFGTRTLSGLRAKLLCTPAVKGGPPTTTTTTTTTTTSSTTTSTTICNQLLSEPFDGTTPPPGWTVINNTTHGGWEFDDPHPRGNLTGGSGNFAIIDSDFLAIGNTEDTFLVSPVIDLSTVADPVLGFDSDYRDLNSVADVDLSIDGGATWTNVWAHGGSDARGPSHVAVPIAAAAGKPQVQIRFHYQGTWAWWWEVDNFTILSCAL